MDTDDESNLSPRRKNNQFSVREDLDHAIKSGDWSLVGATAAIIAQAPAEYISSDINSSYSSVLSSSIASNQTNNQRDEERSAELDKLVEIGDWEGVVLAAAKFEAENDRDNVSEGHQFLASMSHALQSDANSTNSPSVSTNISESASNNLKRAEIRAEVEALVRRVVPDEIENVDEMMHQFRGREEELVETLRTMQERSIAARQREAMRRNAKREARKMAKQNKLPPLGRKVIAGQDKIQTSDLNSSFYSATSDVDQDNVSKPTSKENSNNSTATPTRKALDYAIQMGDWEAVGRTAEQLGDCSVSEASEYHSADERSLVSSKSSPSMTDADRAIEIEALIDNGDWSGVVAAASKYTEADKNGGNSKLLLASTGRDRGSRFNDSVSLNTEAKKEKTLKEEKEALAQADIWMSIAAQSKNENSNGKFYSFIKLSAKRKLSHSNLFSSATQGAASEAADWAISRSLQQIQASSTNDRQDTQSVASSCDDKSV